MTLPIDSLGAALSQQGVARFMEYFANRYGDDVLLKDLAVEEIGPGRLMRTRGRWVVNFGSDSFLGLDRDERVLEALRLGIDRWGAHNGTSRAFSSVASNVEAEEKLADWLGVEATLIYPSVTLANAGALPGLVTRNDVILADEFAHNSIHEATKIAKAGGTRVKNFRHNDIEDLEHQLKAARPYKFAVIAVDGVYSMSGVLPPLREMHDLALEHNAVLYVDDAHGTGVMGTQGRGTVRDALGHYDNLFVVGSLSKAFSCFGGFVGCPASFKQLLKYRSNSYIFGGPVPPCYLDAVCVVIDILSSPEYDEFQLRLRENMDLLIDGARDLGYRVMGGKAPIVSMLVGDEDVTLQAGKFLFEAGYYVQSVTFPAVPFHAGVLRIQLNANHTPDEVSGLVEALARLRDAVPVLESYGEELKAA